MMASARIWTEPGTVEMVELGEQAAVINITGDSYNHPTKGSSGDNAMTMFPYSDFY
jgi:hypothetical protein